MLLVGGRHHCHRLFKLSIITVGQEHEETVSSSYDPHGAASSYSKFYMLQCLLDNHFLRQTLGITFH